MRRVLYLCFGILAVLVVAVGIGWWGVRAPATAEPALSGQVHQYGFDFGGVPRTFSWYVPSQIAGRAPLLIVLHNTSGNGRRMRAMTAYAFDQLADRHGFVVLYPDGYEGQWNDCRAAGDFAARELGLDDIGFLRTAIAWLGREIPLDHKRIYATGLSNGGQLAYRLALEAPDLVAGIAVIAANLPKPLSMVCHPSGRALPVLVINGTEDPINPYDGGEVSWLGPLGAHGEVSSAAETMAYWRDLALHDPEPFEHRYPDLDPDDATVATRQVWSAPGRSEVALITVHGGGHTIPHPDKAFPRILGRTSHDVPAAEEIWRFFSR